MWNNPVFLYFTIWENSKIDIDLFVQKAPLRANLKEYNTYDKANTITNSK